MNGTEEIAELEKKYEAATAKWHAIRAEITKLKKDEAAALRERDAAHASLGAKMRSVLGKK